MIYAEYITRRAGVTVEEFWTVLTEGPKTWEKLRPEDKVILKLGRTWRVGAEPDYLIVIETDGGLESFDQWDRILQRLGQSSELDAAERALYAAFRVDRAGIFDPIIQPKPERSDGGVYYAEVFEPAPDCTHDDIRTLYERREAAASDSLLHLLAVRVGLLGADPAIAVWSASSFEALLPIVTSVAFEGPVKALRGSLYA